MRFGQAWRAFANDGEHEPMLPAPLKQSLAKVDVDAGRQAGVAPSRNGLFDVNGEVASGSTLAAGRSALGLAYVIDLSLVAAGDATAQSALEELLIGALQLVVRRRERCRAMAARRPAGAGHAAGATGAKSGYREGRNPWLHRCGFA
jgi:hypothetical protein